MPTLTKSERIALAAEAKKELVRRSYEDYLTYVYQDRFTIFPHIKLICEYLQRIADGETLSIIIEMPPRHGKSFAVTEAFPSYYLAKNPDKRVIATAYSDSLARKFGRMNRDKILEAGDVFGVSVDPNNSAVNDWGFHKQAGGMIATGIGGSLTGQGADLMLIDDPIKNAEEANSKTMRQKIWDEWESVLSTRLHDGASVIVIMTRWHQDDFVGRLLENKGREWVRLRLPAIAEDENDLLGRPVGEPLCAALGYGKKWAAAKKIEVGSRTWGSLYQQNPTPAEGSIFFRKWFKYYKALPKMDAYVISWDMTFKDSESSDFVVGQAWGRRGAEFYLLDQLRAKMGFPETVKAVQMFAAKHPQILTKLVEDKANGTAVLQTLTSTIPGMLPIEPQGGKITRAQAVTPLFEAGNVFIPDPSIAPWVNDYVEEFASFPNGFHDDQVDSTSQALTRLKASSVQALKFK